MKGDKPNEIDSRSWYVWTPDEPAAGHVYVGTMEECGLIADALNEHRPSDGYGYTSDPLRPRRSATGATS